MKTHRSNLDCRINEFRSLFSPKVIVAGLPLCTCYMSVFLSLCKQQPRFAQDQPKVYFQMKELDRTTEAFARMNVIWEGPVCWVQCANMWQHCSLSAVQTKTACVELSWWPEFDMFGSMPWCSFPWHKLVPRLAQKNCCKVYSLNLIDEFTSFFSAKMIVAGLPRKASHGNRKK